jgi:hypothetical protein
VELEGRVMEGNNRLIWMVRPPLEGPVNSDE